MTGEPVTRPGIYPDVPAEEYHADPALSSSGARLLLPPSCPAKYAAERKAPTKQMERGTAAHTVVLGTGPKLYVIDADDWRKPRHREEADEARAAGLVPVLREQHAKILAMREALYAHRTARLLFAEGSGLPEQSIWWRDPEYGVMCRARPDFLPHGANGMCILADFKTCGDASPEMMRRTVARLGYDQQADWYCTAVEALRPGVDTRFVFVAQETDPPYLVGCYRLRGRDLDEARYKNRRAREIFRDCTNVGRWPAYDPMDGITELSLPGWSYRSYEDY